MYLVVLEASDGSWMDEPIGFDTLQEAKEVTLDRWPKEKLGPGEFIVLYDCSEQDILAEGPKMKTGLDALEPATFDSALSKSLDKDSWDRIKN